MPVTVKDVAVQGTVVRLPDKNNDEISITIPIGSVTQARNAVLELEAGIALAVSVLARAANYSDTDVLTGLRQIFAAVIARIAAGG